LFTPDWVDSAEAERLVAMESASAPMPLIASNEDVRHYRTTLGALTFLGGRSMWYLLMQAAVTAAQPVATRQGQ
jgi:hypothetical protein